MPEEKELKLSCGVCDATYFAEGTTDFPDDLSIGSTVSFVCPVCSHEESKVVE